MSAAGFDLFHQPSAQAGAALDLIFIEGLTGETIIGIHDSELRRPQPLVIDVVAGVARAHGLCHRSHRRHHRLRHGA